jgi:hypothetical protein
VGDLVAAEIADLFGSGLRARLQHDPGTDFLAVFRIRNAEDLDGLHLLVAEQKFLDLARIDVLAAANQHVLHPAHDVAVPVRIDRCEIAPAIDHGLGGARLVTPIALHDRVAAHP